MRYFFFLLVIYASQGFSQELTNFELIDTESGLSNNIVFDTYQDKEGFIWFATDNGLNRYDGYNFKKFFHNPSDSTSLSSNVIRRILEDKEGNLWVGGKYGLNLYDRKNKKFKRYYINNDSDFAIDIQHMELDKNNRIWFNNFKELGYFDIKTKEYKILYSNFHSHSITIEKKNVVWIQSKWGELASVSVDSLNLRKRSNDKKSFEKQIHYGIYSNSLWLPQKSFNKSFKAIPKLPDGAEPVTMKEIDKNTLLIGSSKGLYEYNDQKGLLRKINLTNSFSTLTNQIRSIYKDENQGLWIGTLGGVFHYDNYKNDFHHFDLNNKEADVVMGLEAGVDGMYANTLGKGIYYKSNTSRKFKKINKRNTLFGEDLFVWDIKEITENDYPVWMSTNRGLICYNPKKDIKKKINLPVINAGVEISFNMFNTQRSYVWVASMGSIHKVDKKKGELLESYLIEDGKSRSTVQKIIAFDQKLIFATESQGLFHLDEKTGTTTSMKLKENSKKEISLFKTYIWDLHVFQDVLWIGTNRGLFKLEKGNLIAKPDFIGNEIIFSIEHDNQGRLWLGTSSGLVSYKIDEKTVRKYGKVDGVKNIEFNRRSVTKTSDGTLWFGGVHGITFFNPSQVKVNPIKPKVHITKLDVVVPDSTFSVSYDNRKIVLPHWQNTIELDYVALNYTNSNENSYKYQMIGHDPNWVDGNTRKARYVQLPTGSYNFKVIAANNDGIWNESGDVLEIHILPPYWETWWFRGLIFLLIVTIMIVAYKYRVKRLLEIERMKLRIASDLHDEVGSGLSGIALTSDILEQQVSHGEIKPHLVSRITRNARNLASTLDDIVWLINPEKERLGDFVIKTKTIAQELLPNTHVSFEEHINEGMKNKVLHSELKRNLLMFVKEVINNIAKHSDASSVMIQYMIADKILRLQIKDNGKGFDLNQQTSGNGLISIKNRAKEINGALEIDSEINSGTEVVIEIKIP